MKHCLNGLISQCPVRRVLGEVLPTGQKTSVLSEPLEEVSMH